MAKKVGTLIKEARTNAGLTQEQLAKKISGLSAADVGKAERGEKDLTQEQLKAIAKATGVTQKSLLEAAKGGKSSSSSGSSSSGKKKTGSGTSATVTAEEKKLLTLYRKASDKQKEAALKALKGESGAEEGGNLLGSLLETALGVLTQKDQG